MTREDFLKAIEAGPWDDELARQMYADWLDEHDEPEEATRQRQWVASFKFLATFTRSYDDSYDLDKEYERIPGTGKIYPEDVMKSIGYWKGSVEAGDAPFFSTGYAQDELHNATTRAEFWKAFKVITGIAPSSEIAKQNWYSCAC